MDLFYQFNDFILLLASVFIVISSVYISFRLKFVQFGLFRAVQGMIKSFFFKKKVAGKDTILPYQALFTAMSTTLGIGTIVAPVIAINLGGPGALLGFLVVSFFGAATTYAEVNLCIKYRTKDERGRIISGPMPYLRRLLSPSVAIWYALCCSILMIGWSGAQANQLAALLDSPLLGPLRIPTYISGAILTVFVISILIGGIKRVSSFSSKIVPVMFILYVGSSLWILVANAHLLPAIFTEMFQSAFTPYAMASGTIVGGAANFLRWGILKGSQVSEAGVGTQAIPHSLAETKDPAAQGMLAMLSTFSSGLIAFLSGCIALVTKTWQDPDLTLGMSMVASSYYQYFSTFGIMIISICAILFALGTILGNSYNGSQAFRYLFSKQRIWYYYIVTGLVVFCGSIAEVKTIWSIVDPLMAAIAIPNLVALILYVSKNPQSLLEERVPSTNDSSEILRPQDLLEERVQL